jgi:cytidylate kinase
MIIGIFGPSCVGKTSAASRLGQQRNLPVRFCGAAIRDAARSLVLSLEQLPEEVHRTIDRETLDWALSVKDCVVEGRFLDQVLSGSGLPTFLVQLTATLDARLFRACGRSGDVVSIDELNRWDSADAAFRVRMYARQAVLPTDVLIDNSSLTVEECVDRLGSEIPWPAQQPG